MIAVLLAQADDSIEWVPLIGGLLGGLAIFLFGMDQMTESLRLIAGNSLRGLLLRLTRNRFAGLLSGAGLTAVVQSSSVTTVMVVGFITSGLMTFPQSIGVILGANIGTTVTAQIVAFKVTTYALYGVAIGFAMSFFAKDEARRARGIALLGLGLVFLGMTLMSDAMEPLRSNQRFIDLMAELDNPLYGIAVGALFTALVQSSSATTAIVIVLAQQNLITLDTGIALIMGANVGTSVTALLAGIGKPRDAVRASVAHTMFNVCGVIIWLPFIGVLASLVEAIGGDTAREIANAHTAFNVINAMLAIGFTTQFAHLVERLVPARPEAEEAAIRAKYLDQSLIRTPALALAHARLELLRMADRVRVMVDKSLPAVLTGTHWELTELQELDDEVDALHTHIIDYLGRISETRLGEASTEELSNLMGATNDLEAIGDLIETNMVDLGLTRIEQGLVVSEPTTEMLTEFHARVKEALNLAMLALTQINVEAARDVGRMKREINSLERAAMAHQAERLRADAPDRMAAYKLEIEVITTLKRVYYFSKRIARDAVPEHEKVALLDD